MARKPTLPATVIETAPLPVVQLTQNQLAAASVTEQALAWIDAAQAAGGIKTAAFVATVSDRAIAEIYTSVKESKSYLGMPYRNTEGKVETVSTLEDYCRVFLDKSQRRCEQVVANRRLLGPELYEQAEAIGLTQRDYNAIKALPADSQVVIREALEGKSDRKVIVEKLIALVDQQVSEKQALVEQRNKLQDDYDAAQKRVADKNTEIEALETKRRELERQWKFAKPDEKRIKLEKAITAQANMVRAALLALQNMNRELAELAADDAAREFLGITLAQLLVAVQLVRDDEELPIAIPIVEIEGLGR